jgi:hypothetical protein
MANTRKRKQAPRTTGHGFSKRSEEKREQKIQLQMITPTLLSSSISTLASGPEHPWPQIQSK